VLSVTLLTGINHAAILTDDLERFVAFYVDVFDAEVIFDEVTPAFRHAMVRIGATSVLHAVDQPGNEHRRALPDMLGRGHLDHLGLDAASREAFDEIRSRLCRHGASDGTVHDLGPQLAIWFTDPDGMSGEVCWNRDPALTGFHAPVALAVTG
jgi:catechol 2,3-dioxygenase-like lactoylglutathione lyase family enzyme